jgi:hypothetical protein
MAVVPSIACSRSIGDKAALSAARAGWLVPLAAGL